MTLRRSLALVFLIAANPAWGQDPSKAEVEAAAGEQIGDYVDCLKAVAVTLARDLATTNQVLTVGKGEEIADQAISSCYDQRQVVLERLRMPPLSMSASVALNSVEHMDERLKPLQFRMIEKAYFEAKQ